MNNPILALYQGLVQALKPNDDGSRTPVLWPVRAHTGHLMGITTTDKKRVAALFTSPRLAETWILDTQLEQHFVGHGIPLGRVAGFCDALMLDNWQYVTLNPPATPGDSFRHLPVQRLKDITLENT